MSFPNKEERKVCWDSRDRYWECLDKNNDDNGKCTEWKKKYESSCPSQWVKHFDRKRSYLKFKDRIENDGYEPIKTQNKPSCKTSITNEKSATTVSSH